MSDPSEESEDSTPPEPELLDQQAVRERYRNILALMLRHECTDLEGWMMGGLETEQDRQVMRRYLRRKIKELTK